MIESGSNVSYFDPFIPLLKLNNKAMESHQSLNPDLLNNMDVSVIVTDHSNLDYDIIEKNSKNIVDTRNVFKNYSNKKLSAWERVKSFNFR